MKTLIYPTTLKQRQSRNNVIFWTVCTIAVVLVCIYSPNVFQA
jgi:tellurite resistance protein TehA-like permease